MINGNVFYHGSIRKAIVAFGALFSDIYIDRKQGDSVNGPTVQRLQIPLAYAPKEKWIVRLDSDPNLDKSTYVSLPRMSFEILSYNYDSSRKLPRSQKITCKDSSGSEQASFVYTPVPYNIEISLYILTKTQEDGLQILEQILPTFTPDYTLPVKILPDLRIMQDVPVVLTGVSVADEYDGDFQTRRFVTHTLTFQMKLNLFGNVSGQNIINKVGVNIGQNEDYSSPNRVYTVQGETSTGRILNEDWMFEFGTSSVSPPPPTVFTADSLSVYTDSITITADNL
jgi:hypothetical protein